MGKSGYAPAVTSQIGSAFISFHRDKWGAGNEFSPLAMPQCCKKYRLAKAGGKLRENPRKNNA
jgi:hypothetical protein